MAKQVFTPLFSGFLRVPVTLIRKTILTSSLLFLFFIAGQAQNNFRKGFLITLENDTVYGQIDYRVDKINSAQCLFIPEGSKKPVTYYPGDIAGYRIPEENKYYVSKDISQDEEGSFVFLEFIMQGIVNLYYYADSWNIEYYFFENKAGEMRFILKRGNQQDSHLLAQTTIDIEYDSEIRSIFRDCDYVVDYDGIIPFNHKTMIEIIKTCFPGKDYVIYKKNKPEKTGTKFKFSLYGGAQYFKLSALHNKIILADEQVSPRIGGRVALINNRYHAAFGVVLDVALSRIEMETDGVDLGFGRYEKFRTETLLSLNSLGFKVDFVNRSRITPTIEAGGLCAFAFNKDLKVSYGEIINGELVYPSEFNSDLDRAFAGFYVSGGLNYKFNKGNNIFLLVGYERYYMKEDLVNTISKKLQSAQLKLGYTF